MRMTLYSEDEPKIYINLDGEFCNIAKIEQHIRTMQVARAWLLRQRRVKSEREKNASAALKAKK